MANLSNINNKFLVTNGGKVGIGITAPTGILHTDQTFSGYAPVTFKNSVTNQGQFVELITSTDEGSKYTGIESISLQTGNGWKVWGGGNNFGEMYLSVSGSHAIVIKSNLNVGIGTNSPGQKLVVEADWNGSLSNNQQLQIQGATDITLQLRLGYDTTNDYAEIAAIKSGTGYKNLILNRGGANVGIGTTIPGGKLSVGSGLAKTSTSTSDVLYLGQSNEASNYSALQVYTKGGASQADRSVFFQTIETGVANAGNIVFQPSGGNVGIGTDSLAKKLSVNAGSTSSDGIIVTGSSSPAIHINETSGTVNSSFQNDGAGSYLGTTTSHPLILRTANTARYKITESGSHQWTTDGSFSTSFTYSFRDAVGINNPNSVSAQAVAGYVLSVGRSNDASTSVSGGIISQGESHFVRGVSFGPSGQGQILDHYEEGTWTPVLQGGSVTGAATYSTQLGKYTKIGRLVTFWFSITWTTHTGSGTAQVAGLPFASGNGSQTPACGVFTYKEPFTANNVPNGGIISSAGTIWYHWQVPVGGGISSGIPLISDVNGKELQVNGQYYTA